MAGESPERSPIKTPLADATGNSLAFSIDSLQLGDSTRSLLSPLYDRGNDSLRKQGDESSDDEDVAKAIHTATYSECSFEDDSPETATVKKTEERRASRSSSSTYSCSSSRTSTPSKNCTISSRSSSDIEPELSPWEKWLLSKVIEDHKKAKSKGKKKLLEKEIEEKERAERVEKERQEEANRLKWLELKNREGRVSKEIKRQQEKLQAEQERQEKEKVHEKSDKSYKNWMESKRSERKQRMDTERMEGREKRDEENDREQRSQEAYERWLEKAKTQPKLTNNHFGYLNGRVTGYYDWTCYPMPSYNNPTPWVSPKIRKRVGKIKQQNPSPPLLFKEIAERESKRNNVNQKLRKNTWE